MTPAARIAGQRRRVRDTETIAIRPALVPIVARIVSAARAEGSPDA